MSIQHQYTPKVKKSPKTDWTLEQYFDREYKAEVKHEFHNGEIRAMAYTSIPHGELFANLILLLGNCIISKVCRVFGSDRMLFVKECKKVYYPDLLILCGIHETFDYKGKMQATLNPSVLIEITSLSTESEDRIDKLACYKTIPSLKQYVIVSHRKRAVEIYNRTEENNKWLNTEITNDDDYVEINDCKILLKDIYNRVEL
jgi:Uma2 family endonuclease